MTKQELANKIWASTNTLRGNIELGTYKDYMLSLLFYKFLSDKEEKYLLDQGWEKDDIKDINESDTETVKDCRKNIGYFIAYENLFSTWVSMEHDFSVTNVIDGLNAFDRLIGDSHKRVFSKIFETLQSNISNLGSTAQDQTKALKSLIETINDIPAETTQGYDSLGFIYEFLIGNFAANAGKKAGEFYTPHEVSVLMSEIVCNHLKDRASVKILDPTSGSGSLLITIGKTFARYSGKKDNVEYYAQEFIKSTYNLTRMNLLMKGILPDNINVRNGDTLARDWPFFDDRDPDNTYDPLYVDAVVSNPPYSQKWNPKNREADPRFSSYGIAPKGKADFAFLLYDLYHIKPDGIATVVLPHGVLFRGNEEKTIRERLIENNKIDAIIGLPGNAFYGTSIATILMVLKQNRENTDILIIDASKGFIRDGKKNKLQSKDIKKIADTYIARSEQEGYSRKVSKNEIVANDYNLNIPRYVDSFEGSEKWDIYALMNGGIPNYEIDELEELWEAFPSLRADIFEAINQKYSRIKSDNIWQAISENADVKAFIKAFHGNFDSFEDYLREALIVDPASVSTANEEETITDEIFSRYDGIPLVDAYKAYQILDDLYSAISTDIETIQAEGFSAVRKVDPNMVTKKKDDKTIEVQDGWKGRVLPFELVQNTYIKDGVAGVSSCKDRLAQITAEYEEILGSMSAEEKDSPAVSEDNSSFVASEMTGVLRDILADVSTPEIDALNGYLEVLSRGAKKTEKLSYIKTTDFVNWSAMEPSKDGTYSKKAVTSYIQTLQMGFEFDADSYEEKMLRVSALMQEEKEIKKLLKEKQKWLEEKTIKYINTITDDEAKEILEQKWIKPLTTLVLESPSAMLKKYSDAIEQLGYKYETTITDVELQIRETEKQLVQMMRELNGTGFDMQGLEAFIKLLGGN